MSELNLDKPVQTVSGIPVTLLKRDAKGPYPLIGFLEDGEVQHPETWDANGRYRAGYGLSEMDLVNGLETRHINAWIIFWNDGRITTTLARPYHRTGIFAVHPVNVTLKKGEGFPNE